ncbi:hypothetical protein BVX97_03980 [bacterium E08(2017)]|nr:hypothetical protein BVX97_03980 [bacterium E08(2017)]
MALLDNNFNGLQHIGVPVTDVERSEKYYAKLGFEKILSEDFDHPAGTGHCIMMRRAGVVMELYRMPEAELEEIRSRKNGHIDHIAFNVTDIDKAYAELKSAGIEIDEDEPQFIDFLENGCKYFNTIGPDGERLEYLQIL